MDSKASMEVTLLIDTEKPEDFRNIEAAIMYNLCFRQLDTGFKDESVVISDLEIVSMKRVETTK